MKTFSIMSMLAFLLMSVQVMGQSPEAVSYQVVVRDAGGNLIVGQQVQLRLSILQGSASGTAVFVETHLKATNAYGVLVVDIGLGSPVSGDFATISWGTDNYFLKTEIDPAGGTSYQTMGTTQFLSVPYALYAKTSGSSSLPGGVSGQTIRHDGSDWVSAGNLYNDGTVVGIGTTNPDPTAALDVNAVTQGFLPPRMTHDQVDDIVNPAEGLIVFCTDCESGSTGRLLSFMNGQWRILTAECLVPMNPVEGIHVPDYTQIIWNWGSVPYATGYKWNTVNDYSTATDMGINTTFTETGLANNTLFTRYVWSYNACGSSQVTSLEETTLMPWTCGVSTITVNHNTANGVAPVYKTVTYETVTNIPGVPTKCWITSNLGADHQASSVIDATEASAGWYWQFNRPQGYKHDGVGRIPATTWIMAIVENSDWQAVNDPCTIELGTGWRLPTWGEWSSVTTGWTNWNNAWNSNLKLHAAGLLLQATGGLDSRGNLGAYWSMTQSPYTNAAVSMTFTSGSVGVQYADKAYGRSLRCIKD